jgi:hypothetical protein
MTPITVVKGNLELVKEGQKEVSKDLIETISNQVDGLYQLIHDKLYKNLDRMTVPTTDGLTPAEGTTW